jgi:tyrosyl-tRNA synthetase
MIESDVEFGGIDQKFNCLMGRELQEITGQKPQQVFFTPLLVGLDGKMKMSKSLDNYIGVDEPPNDMYGKVMSLTDELIVDYFELLTDVPNEELTEFRRQIETNSINPMELKKRLAREIVTQLRDQKAAIAAEEHFSKVIQKREVPEEIKEGTKTKSGDTLRDYLVKNQLAKSRSEAKRLIEQGAVEVDGKKITDVTETVSKGAIIKVGKRNYIKST